jgi:3-oxoacyl-[acyl-carrier-protein] synthase-3
VNELLQAVPGLVLGDGAGALVLEPSDHPDRGVCARQFRRDATRWRDAVGATPRPAMATCERCGGAEDRAFGTHTTDLLVAAFALLGPAIEDIMRQTGWSYDELDAVFCLQPSKRLVEEIIAALGPASAVGSKLWGTAERFGNTATASLPLALAEAQAAGTLVAGAKVLMLGGSGVSAAAMAMVW